MVFPLLGPLILLLFASSMPTHAGLLELMSRGAYYAHGGKRCDAVDTIATAQALERARRNCGPSQSLADHTGDLAEVAETTLNSQFWEVLAKRNAKELGCAAKFASDVSTHDVDPQAFKNLKANLRELRNAKLALNETTKKLAEDKTLAAKACPLSIQQLESDSTPFTKGRYEDLCREVITARLAYQTIRAAIPLANLPAVRQFVDRYSNSPGEDLSDSELENQIRKSYRAGEKQLKIQEKDLVKKASDPDYEFDRSQKQALLSDPRVVNAMIEDSGNSADLGSFACRMDADYGQGAENLDTDLMIGSFVFGGVSGIVGRASAFGGKIIQGLRAARAEGTISLGTAQVLRAAAMGVNTLSTYDLIDKGCLAKSKPKMLGQGCVAAPDIKTIEEESCALALTLASIGWRSMAPNGVIATRLEWLMKDKMPVWVKDKVEIIFFPSSHHTKLRIGDFTYGNECPGGRCVIIPADKIDQTAMSFLAKGRQIRFKVKVTEDELARLEKYVEDGRFGFGFSCSHDACKALTETTGLIAPLPLTLGPFTNALYLSALRAVPGSRITKIEIRAQHKPMSFSGAKVEARHIGWGSAVVGIAGTPVVMAIYTDRSPKKPIEVPLDLERVAYK